MPTYGPTLCGTGANDASIGSVAWTNPGNITADDASYATITGGDAGGGCFIAGTLVNSEFGLVPIQLLMRGDRVYSGYGDVIDSEIVHVHAIEVDEYYILEFGELSIGVTGEHPFKRGDEFVNVFEINAGDVLSGFVLRSKTLRSKKTTVYNLTVSEPHTYCVHGIIVHNK